MTTENITSGITQKPHEKINQKILATVIYRVSVRTMQEYLDPIKKQLNALATKKSYRSPKTGNMKTGKRRYYNTKQLALIVKHCDQPTNYTFNGKKFILDKD